MSMMCMKCQCAVLAAVAAACALATACSSTGNAYNPPHSGNGGGGGGGSNVEVIAWDEFAPTPDPQIEYTQLPLSSSSTVTQVTGSATNMLDYSCNMLADSSHRVWVISFPPGSPAQTAEIFANPNSAPITITFAGTGNFCGGVAFDKSGNLWAVDYQDGSIYEYSGPFNNSETLTQSDATVYIHGAFPKSSGIAVDSSGNVYVSNSAMNEGTNNIAVYKAPVTSSSTVDHYLGGMAAPTALIFDAQGNLYAGGYQGTACSANCDFGIARYNADNLGPNAVPNVVDNTGMAAVDANQYSAEFATDAEGNLYVADCGDTGAIFVYPSVATQFSSTEAPSLVYQDSTLTSLKCAWGIAVDQVPASAVRSSLRRIPQQVLRLEPVGRAARDAMARRWPLLNR